MMSTSALRKSEMVVAVSVIICMPTARDSSTRRRCRLTLSGSEKAAYSAVGIVYALRMAVYTLKYSELSVADEYSRIMNAAKSQI